MKVIVRLLMILFSLQMFSQGHIRNFKNDSITVSIDYNKYRKVAYDSVKSIYMNQKRMINDNTFPNPKEAISELFKFEELEYTSIPVFKIKKSYKKFNSNSSFENFIDFTANFGFQKIILFNEKSIINYIDIPDFSFELSKMNKSNFRYTYDKFDYENKVLKIFINANNVDVIKLIEKIIKTRSKNTFFAIFGLNKLIFEIDKGTGLLYVNKISYSGNENRVLANDYIMNNVGLKKINDLAKDVYDTSETHKLNKKCTPKNVIIKVNN